MLVQLDKRRDTGCLSSSAIPFRARKDSCKTDSVPEPASRWQVQRSGLIRADPCDLEDLHACQLGKHAGHVRVGILVSTSHIDCNLRRYHYQLL